MRDDQLDSDNANERLVDDSAAMVSAKTGIETRVGKITCFCFNYYYNLKFSITIQLVVAEPLINKLVLV